MQASPTADDIVEYEGLPPTFSFSAHLMAGAIAGITEHGIIYPLDSIKTRMQIFTSSTASAVVGSAGVSGSTGGMSLGQTLRSVTSSEGIITQISWGYL